MDNLTANFIDPNKQTKMRSTDRKFVLEVIDGKAPINSKGLVDSRLFTGENKLHALRDDQTSLWYLKYDVGMVPEPLKQRFTKFSTLQQYVEKYFLSRNVRIKEIID